MTTPEKSPFDAIIRAMVPVRCPACAATVMYLRVTPTGHEICETCYGFAQLAGEIEVLDGNA